MDHKRKLTQPIDVTLGFWLMSGGLFVALLESIYFAVLGYDLPLMALVFPAALIVLGLSLVFFDVVERGTGITDDLANLPELVADDLDDLRRYRFTRTHFMVISAPLLLVIQGYLFVEYDKWSANWGGINVLVVALIVALFGAYRLLRTQWFRRRVLRTPNWIITVTVIGFVLSGGLGIYYTEPDPVEPVYVDDVPVQNTQAYNYENTRIGRSGSSHWYWLDDGWVSGGSCDDDGCLFLVLIIVIVVVVLASIFVPHFWMIGTSLLIAIFMIQTLRELLYVDQDHPRHPWYTEKTTAK